MPKSKVRKKVKQRRAEHASNGTQVTEAMLIPVWEYADAARQMRNDEGIPEEQGMLIALAQPIRLAPPGTRMVREYLPADLAREGGMTVMEWYESFLALHEGGFMAWSNEAKSHYTTTPEGE